MNRPYDSDENATWHIDEDCDDFEGLSMGDANYDGVSKGVANYGDGICPSCIDGKTRSQMLLTAADHAEL